MKTARLLLAAAFCLTVSATDVATAPQETKRPDAKKRALRLGEVNTPPAPGERHPDTLKVGDPAPDFTLADPVGKQQIKLSSFQGKKPVVLIFGSFT
jgi:hypothetical protein